MKSLQFKGWDTKVVKAKYVDDGLALVLVEKDDASSIVATVTSNLGVPGLEENQAFVKDYSENEGMLEALKEAGMVNEIIGWRQSGWVKFPLVDFDLEGVEEM